MTEANVDGRATYYLRYDGRGRLQFTNGGGGAIGHSLYDGDALIFMPI